MTPKFMNYAIGSVKIKVRGAMPEKFINLCVAQHIFLWGIVKQGDELYAWIRLSDFMRIRPLVRISQTKVSVSGFYGWPFMAKKILRRKMLVIGAVLFLISLHVLASYVWFVDVKGLKTLAPSQVRHVAESQGLKPGITKDTISTKSIENAILLSMPEVAWVSVSFTGTRAVIEVVEKTLPKLEDKAPAHIVAAKDGVITEIISLAGQAAVKKGDTVKRGDLLIKGFSQESAAPATPGQPPVITIPSQFIKANGIVKARVWYESYGEAALSKEIRERTGRQETAVLLNIGGHQLTLKQEPASLFTLYDEEVIHKSLPRWRNSELIVESTIRVYHELSSFNQEQTLDQARDEAAAKALHAVQELVPESAQIVARHIETLRLNEANIVRVKVSVETIEDIGNSMVISQ